MSTSIVGTTASSPVKRRATSMLRGLVLVTVLWVAPVDTGYALTSLDTATISKSVVFFYAADPSGNVQPTALMATGFLVSVPLKEGPKGYSYGFIVTARHVVDPIWAGCQGANPARLFLRINKMQSDPQRNKEGFKYIPVDLGPPDARTWVKSEDDDVDVAILHAPTELTPSQYDVQFLAFYNFGKPEEIAKLGIGSQIASSGLVPGLEGRSRPRSARKQVNLSYCDATISRTC